MARSGPEHCVEAVTITTSIIHLHKVTLFLVVFVVVLVPFFFFFGGVQDLLVYCVCVSVQAQNFNSRSSKS